jgi:hypothetical protein
VASAVQSIARSLLGVAEDDVVEIIWVKPCAINGTLARDRSEFLCREIFQLAAVTAKGRTRPTHNCNVPWFEHGSLVFNLLEWFPLIRKIPSGLTKLVSLTAANDSGK